MKKKTKTFKFNYKRQKAMHLMNKKYLHQYTINKTLINKLLKIKN